MKLTVRKSENLDDWWIIERAEHDGRVWLEPTEFGHQLMCSSRISNADIEGTSVEMLAIAAAIKSRGAVSFKRCAVRVEGERVFLLSPRNSTTEGECSLKEADELASLIEKTVPAPPADRVGEV